MVLASVNREAAVTDAAIRAYWNARIDDTRLGDYVPGTAEHFAAMDRYRFAKAAYLGRIVDSDAWRGCEILDVGCGAGLDLVRFARAGARVAGVDVSTTALGLARRYVEAEGITARLLFADGAALPFPAGCFDLVWCHGVLPFVRDPGAVVTEAERVLRAGGRAIFMAYNRHSWVSLARIFGLSLGHADAPAFRMFSRRELSDLLSTFAECRIEGERLPEGARREGMGSSPFAASAGTLSRLVPRRWLERAGWHWMAYCSKSAEPATEAVR
jgi:SAM-dependent methyltransferase